MQADPKDSARGLVFAAYHGKSWRSLLLWRAGKNPRRLFLSPYAEDRCCCLLECQGCVARSSESEHVGAPGGPKEQRAFRLRHPRPANTSCAGCRKKLGSLNSRWLQNPSKPMDPAVSVTS